MNILYTHAGAMTREKRFHIRLTEEEFEELHLEAERRNVSMAEVMRDLIKSLRRRRRQGGTETWETSPADTPP